MSHVKLGLAAMPLYQKMQFGWRINDAMLEHPDIYPDPPMSADDFTTLLVALQEEMDAVATARTQLREALAQEGDTAALVTSAMAQYGIYVQKMSGGDEALIALAAMEVSRAPSPVGRLPKPQGLKAASGSHAGEVLLRWKPVRGKSSYVIDQTTDVTSPAAWRRTGMCTKAKAYVDGLSSGTRYWFRVAAVGAAGQGPWSEVAAGVAG